MHSVDVSVQLRREELQTERTLASVSVYWSPGLYDVSSSEVESGVW